MSESYDNINFVKACRDAAGSCGDILAEKIMRDRADALGKAISRMNDERSLEAMRQVNACFIRAYNQFVKLQKPAPTPPTSGAGTPDHKELIVAKAA